MQALPIAAVLIVMTVALYAGRDQLTGAITASGSFIASQFSGGATAAAHVAPTSSPATTAFKADVHTAATKPATGGATEQSSKAQQAAGTAAAGAADATAKPKQDGPGSAAATAATTTNAGAAGGQAQGQAGTAAAATTVATAVQGNAGAAAEPKLITTVDHKGQQVRILDVPIPADCHAQNHADYAGDGVVWGLGNKKASAADCCQACKDHAKTHSHMPCNVWVWCGDPSGICWTMDIHNHTTGDCWLKHQAKWDNNPDLTQSNLEINHSGKFSAEFRATHKTSPEMVPWVAGLIPGSKPAGGQARRLGRV